MSENDKTTEAPESQVTDAAAEAKKPQTTESIDTSQEKPAVTDKPNPIEVNEPPKRFPNTVTQKSVQSFETTGPLPESMKNDDILYIPSMPVGKQNEVGDEITELVRTGALGTAAVAWLNAIEEADKLLPLLEAYASTVENPNAKFEQAVPSSVGPLRAGKGSQRPVSNVVLTGEKAINYVRGQQGMGTTTKVPLWHSGFWITINAPDEVELLDLNRRIAQSKIKLGRYTAGAVFANTRAYTSDILVDFALSHMIATSVKVPDTVELKTLILVHDIPALIWGIACTVWPNGFRYRSACMAEPATCNHIVEDKLNLNWIYHADTQALSASQIAHMVNSSKDVMTYDSVKTYQDQFLKNQGREVTIYPGEDKQIKFLLKTPTALEYIQHGSRWIENAVATVVASLGMDADDNARDTYIQKTAQTNVMRNYSHWVKKIIVGDDNVTIEDTETIEATLGTLSGQDDLRNKFDEAVAKYIDDSVMSLIGVYAYDCPMCNKDQTPEKVLPRFSNIIPLDAYQLFFTLLVQKIASMAQR